MNPSIAAFWDLFQQRAGTLAMATSANEAVYDELLESLHRIDKGLSLEFSVDPEGLEIIVSADGNRDLFPKAREVVAAAPEIEGCSIRALKPQLEFPESVQWEGLEVPLADVFFEPLGRSGSSVLGLRLYVAGLDEANKDAIHSALLNAIDHGLGEERHATAIQFTELRALPDDVNLKDLIPLMGLDEFLKWREARDPDATE